MGHSRTRPRRGPPAIPVGGGPSFLFSSLVSAIQERLILVNAGVC